jgi:hypothetical protein
MQGGKPLSPFKAIGNVFFTNELHQKLSQMRKECVLAFSNVGMLDAEGGTSP